MRSPTERQTFIVLKRKEGKTLEEIGILYQREFKTKANLPREKVRQVLAGFGMR